MEMQDEDEEEGMKMRMRMKLSMKQEWREEKRTMVIEETDMRIREYGSSRQVQFG